MSTKTIIILLLTVGLLMSAFTQVNAKGNTSTQLGYGLTTCGQYNQLRKQDPVIETIFDAWVLGYLSGVNFIVHTAKGELFSGSGFGATLLGFLLAPLKFSGYILSDKMIRHTCRIFINSFTRLKFPGN